MNDKRQIYGIAAELTDPFYATSHGAAVSNYDAGIVSGNVNLYCSAKGLAPVYRGSMDKDALRKALNRPETTVIHLNHPVGHPAK